MRLVASTGLTVLPASHQLGYLPIESALGAGAISAQLCPTDPPDWAEIDYEAGDVLTFSSLTVHRALPAQIKNQILIVSGCALSTC